MMPEITADVIASLVAKLKLLSLALEHNHLSHEAANSSFYLIQEMIDQLGQIRPKSEPSIDPSTALEGLEYAHAHINTLMLATENPLFSRQDAYKVLEEASTLIAKAKTDLQRQIDALS